VNPLSSNIKKAKDSKKKAMLLIENRQIICDGISVQEELANKSTLIQNQVFSRAVEMSFDAIVIGQTNGEITFVNDAASKMFSYNKEDLIGKHVLEFVAAHDQEKALKLSLESIETGQGYLSQFSVIRKDKSEFPIEVTASVIKDERGNAIGFIDIIRSLEERKRTEKIIQKSKKLYQNLFMNMLDGFAFCQMLFDPHGIPEDFVYLEINGAFECLTGLRREDVVGKKVTQAIPGIKEANPEIFEIYGRVSLNGEPERFEIFFKTLKIWLDITVYSPKKGYFVAVFENVTERKEIEKKLVNHSEELELTVKEKTTQLSKAKETVIINERLATIGQLAGMVGHDLRNPLSGIKNAAYFLRKKQPNLLDSSLEMLSVIDDAVEYSNKIINDLLDFSRELHLELEECSPKSLVDYVLLSFKIPKNIKISDRTECAPLIWVDTSKIQRVFTNIISNAFEAMTHGGTLEITSQKNDDDIVFVFCDTGEGMSEETLAKLFTPLFTTKAKGMGFGLAICKRIVEAHRGNIEVSSIRGKGTTFKVILPIDRNYESANKRF
jgi:PAS domain S-box-containing protein